MPTLSTAVTHQIPWEENSEKISTQKVYFGAFLGQHLPVNEERLQDELRDNISSDVVTRDLS